MEEKNIKQKKELKFMKKKTIKKKKINSDKLPDVAVLMANAFLAGLITKYYCEQLMLLKKRSKKWHKG